MYHGKSEWNAEKKEKRKKKNGRIEKGENGEVWESEIEKVEQNWQKKTDVAATAVMLKIHFVW